MQETNENVSELLTEKISLANEHINAYYLRRSGYHPGHADSYLLN